MDKVALKAEIDTDPAGIGYAALLPDAPGAVCERLNAKTQTMHKTRMISYKGLYASYGIGRVLAKSVLGKIRAAAQADQGIYDIEKMIYSDAGMDIGEPEALAMLGDLLASGLFTAQEVDALRAISVQPASRAEVLFGANTLVTVDNLRDSGVI